MRSDSWPRLPGSYHGSGCTLASAIAATIANGLEMSEAVQGRAGIHLANAESGVPARHGPAHSGPAVLGARRGEGRWRRRARCSRVKPRDLAGCTPSRPTSPIRADLLAAAEAALAGGARVLQYRNKIGDCGIAIRAGTRPARAVPEVPGAADHQRRSRSRAGRGCRRRASGRGRRRHSPQRARGWGRQDPRRVLLRPA